MARKNLIEISQSSSDANDDPTLRAQRPIAGFVPNVRNGARVGGITKTLGNITEKIERASNIERQLAEGQVIVELDPDMIDSSFIKDRLEINSSELGELEKQIREHGQQVPILVRPSPDAKGRFQVAYGHRRLAAIRQIGIKVRAVVRDLTDDQLVVSQGQENNARTNLSYIERALFATRLDERGFTRDVTMSALGVDKAALSKMLIVMKQIPFALIGAIGAAPEIGRRRWMELGTLVEGNDANSVIAELSADNYRRLDSEQRFQYAVQAFSQAVKNETSSATHQLSGGVPVAIKRTKTSSALVFDIKAAPGFDKFVYQRLGKLFDEFQQVKGD